MLAVIRLRGKVGLDKKKEDTLNLLGLKRKNSCVLIPEGRSRLGMAEKVRDYVTYGEVSEEMIERLAKKRTGSTKGSFRLGSPKKVLKNLSEGVIQRVNSVTEEIK